MPRGEDGHQNSFVHSEPQTQRVGVDLAISGSRMRNEMEFRTMYLPNRGAIP